MAIAIIIPNRDTSILEKELCILLPNTRIEVYPNIERKEEVTTIISWKHPENIFNEFTNIKMICSLGAGVDHILQDKSLPPNIPITRVIDKGLTIQMRKYLLMAVLSQYKDIFSFYEQKRNRKWFSEFKLDDEVTVGVMGLGVLGKDIAAHLHQVGFKVIGYANSPKEINDIPCYSNENGELSTFLNQTNILISIMPLTPETEGVLNLELFRQLPKSSIFINVGRGKHLVEEDLVKAIELGYIKSAMLDVFNEEPLPPKHLFWDFPEIIITPHIASITNQKVAARQIAENCQRLKEGKDLINVVDREKGY